MRKKFILVFATMILSIFLFTPTTFAVDKYGKVEGVTGKDSFQSGSDAKITSYQEGDQKVFVVTYGAMDLKYVKENTEIGRTIEAAWVGARAYAPDGTDENINDITFRVLNSSGEWTEKKFKDFKDSKAAPHYIDLYGAVTKEKLEAVAKEGKDNLVVGTWEFDWNNNKKYEQKIIIQIDPQVVKLSDQKGESLFTPEKYNEIASQETMPKTGDNKTLLYVSLIAIASVAGICTLNKIR